MFSCDKAHISSSKLNLKSAGATYTLLSGYLLLFFGEIEFDCIDVAKCDLVHKVETIF